MCSVQTVGAWPSTLGRRSKSFPEQFSKEFKGNPMTSKLVRFLLAMAFAFSASALAQTNTSAAELPAAPSAAAAAPAASAPAPAPTADSASKIATINIEQAIYASNEGQRDFGALSKKLEPTQTKLKGMSDELDSLKKQLNAQSKTLSDDARANLVRQIDMKQKAFDRAMQDARDDAQTQQSDIAQKILQKMGPALIKYVQDNGYTLLLDTSNSWPQGPVMWAGNSDITRAFVEAYNAQSGVAPPPKPTASATHPAATKPAAKK
jgi:Skp family chaperone for outer membrane proteins